MLFIVADPQFLLEGGAGERVQGARAAYGTCFVCADRQGRQVIPGTGFRSACRFGRLPTSCQIRHSKGTMGNKIASEAVCAHEWD